MEKVNCSPETLNWVIKLLLILQGIATMKLINKIRRRTTL